MAWQHLFPLPSEYDQKILDDKGHIVEAAADSTCLFVDTFANHENSNTDDMLTVTTIRIPAQDTMRFIMRIARVAQFARILDDETKEILREIERIARHEVSRRNSTT